MHTIFIGTSNHGKLKEFEDAFEQLPISVTNPTNLGLNAEIAETGKTFSQNALFKARAWAKLSHLPTLVDDSGLCVDTLDGKPGIYSARFAPGADKDRNQKILDLLKDTPLNQRGAHYTCAIAFIDYENNLEYVTEGICNGQILTEPKGNFGFGYDPIFQPDGYDQSFGQLSLSVKQLISHRAVALTKMKKYLEKWALNTA